MAPTKLGQIFAPWIFREKAYRELPFGGPQVFLEEDLVIPAGTNWGSTPHTIGEFEVPGDTLGLFGVIMEVEDAAALGANALYFQIDTSPGGATIVYSQLGEGLTPTYSTSVVVYGQEPFLNVTDPLPDTLSLMVNFWTGHGPLVNDVHVVRARASSLLM